MIRPQDSLQMVMNPKRPERRVLALVLATVACVCLAYAGVSRLWMFNEATGLGGSYGFGPRGMVRCDERGAECEALSNGELVDRWRTEIADTQRVAALLADPSSQAPADTMVTERVAHVQRQIADGLITREQAIGDAQNTAKLVAELKRASAAFAICGWLACIGSLLASASLAVAIVLVLLKKRLMLSVMPTTTALLGIMLAIVTGCVFVATKPGPNGFVGIYYGFWAFAAGIILGISSTLMLNGLLRPHDHDLRDEPMNPDEF